MTVDARAVGTDTQALTLEEFVSRPTMARHLSAGAGDQDLDFEKGDSFELGLRVGYTFNEAKYELALYGRNITDEEALRVKKSGGYVSPTFTEWMMDGIWPEDITPQQCADMIDYYVDLLGVDHVGIASDDMFTTEPTMNFVAANPGLYADGGYMTDAFDRGATGCAELSKILAAITDELWKRGFSNASCPPSICHPLPRTPATAWPMAHRLRHQRRSPKHFWRRAGSYRSYPH